jgi:hypothetical protein
VQVLIDRNDQFPDIIMFLLHPLYQRVIRHPGRQQFFFLEEVGSDMIFPVPTGVCPHPFDIRIILKTLPDLPYI